MALFATPIALKAAHQQPEEVEKAAESFLSDILSRDYEHVEVKARGIDTRLNLAQCSGKLEPFIPHGRNPLRASTVGVSCNGAEPWTIYVRMDIEIETPVVVASRPISRGTILASNDVSMERRDIRRLYGNWFTKVSEVTGLEAQRSIRQGDPITSNAIDQPILVSRGNRVTIKAVVGSSISITTSGEAQEDGRKGDTIRVKNLESGTEIDARVVGPGVVRVGQ
jgi:flagella basal body P-ring formation protein FlgA